MGIGRGLITLSLAVSLAAQSASAGTCENNFDSTYQLIQSAIFERRGCTSVTCHSGDFPAGALDLSGPDSYENLVDAAVTSIVPGPFLRRVVPARKEYSLLWLNVAAATLPEEWTAPLRPMPQGAFAPLTLDELRVIQLWIENGAPRDGVVEGTGELLDACLPPPEPLETKPLDPPAPGTGVQFRAPQQILEPNSEREVCFLTYFDITDQVPEESRGPEDTFRYRRLESRQDPLSHHAVLVPYAGDTPIDSPVWGEWTCGGGTHHGEPCDPLNDICKPDGLCHSAYQKAVGCIGFGPGDASIGLGNDSLFNTMATGLGSTEGVFGEAPMKGLLIWNSHAFNVTDQPGKLDIWVNLDFATPAQQQHQLQRFTDINAMFRLNVPAFGTQEICSHYVMPPDANLIELSSHNHRRGKRFEIFEGQFRCAGGSNDGMACRPLASADFDTDLCDGAPCTALAPPAGGDCNGDLKVVVAELVTGVGIALHPERLSQCPPFDANGDQKVSVAELVGAVAAALNPQQRDGEESLLYTSLTYSDPAAVKFDPPKVLGTTGSANAARTLTYCALYDNGATDPDEVKQRATSPQPSSNFGGGPCATPVACTAGRIGEPCSGASEDTRNASCDSTPGMGDGFCDACPVRFGTTTEDEMFILLGAFY